MHLSPETQTLFLQSTREILRRHLSNDATPFAFSENPELAQPAGCFVSLHTRATHALRGCIGVIDASKPLHEALSSAAGSVLDDPRFREDPVKLEELPNLEVEVTILGPLKPADTPLDFDSHNEGIYLTIGSRAGCFLPQVARETGWSKEQLLAKLCTEKMGLAADAWNSREAMLQVFKAVILGPE